MRAPPFLALLVAIVLSPAFASETPSDPASEARATIETANADWEKCIVTLELDCIVASYAEDAIFVLADGGTIVGKGAIRDLYAARATSKTTILSAKIHNDGIAGIAPDLVYEWGTGTVLAKAPDGTEATRGGPYLTVWRRGADGVWRIVRNLVF